MRRRVVSALMGLALLGGVVTAGLTPGQSSSAEASVGGCGELLWAAFYHAVHDNPDYAKQLMDWFVANGC